MNPISGVPPGGSPPQGPSGAGGTVTVARGDTLSEISRRLGVSLPSLLQANPQIRDPNRIRIGQQINVPAGRATTDSAMTSAPTSTPQFERTGAPTPFGATGQATSTAGDGALRGGFAEAMARSGVPEGLRSRIDAALQGLSGPALQAEVALLRDGVMNSPNRDRALETYGELAGLRRQHPQRIAADVVQTLTRGVAEPRTGTAQGSEGILGRDQAVAAARTLASLSSVDHTAVSALLRQAGSSAGAARGADPQLERALILKAVAAREISLPYASPMDRLRAQQGVPSEDMADVQRFAREIHGMPHAELARRTSPLDLDGDRRNEALRQQHSGACGIAVAQMLAAERDPIAALSLHREPIHLRDPGSAVARFQERMLDRFSDPYQTADGRSHPGSSMTRLLGDFIGPSIGRVFEAIAVPNDAAARREHLGAIADMIGRGIDVPVRLELANGAKHGVLFSDVRGGGDAREFLVTDPVNGATRWIPERAMIDPNVIQVGGRDAPDPFPRILGWDASAPDLHAADLNRSRSEIAARAAEGLEG